jgi:hypothetical protein
LERLQPGEVGGVFDDEGVALSSPVDGFAAVRRDCFTFFFGFLASGSFSSVAATDGALSSVLVESNFVEPSDVDDDELGAALVLAGSDSSWARTEEIAGDGRSSSPSSGSLKAVAGESVDFVVISSCADDEMSLGLLLFSFSGEC